MIRAISFAALWVFPVLVLGQDVVFKAETSAVILNISAVQPNGKLCGGLKKNDFVVLEDGQPQDIVNFSKAPPPVDLTLVLDFSTSILGSADLVAAAARQAVLRMKPGDRMRIVQVGGAGKDSSMESFSLDKKALLAVINEMEKQGAGGSTPLLKSLTEVLKVNSDNYDPDRGQAILLYSDGQDNNGGMVATADKMMKTLGPLVQESATVIHTIGPPGEPIFPDTWSERMRNENRERLKQGLLVLESLSTESGGGNHTSHNARDLDKIFDKIQGDISNRYTIAYSPKNGENNSEHKIEVKLKGHPNCVVRTRKSYSTDVQMRSKAPPKVVTPSPASH